MISGLEDSAALMEVLAEIRDELREIRVALQTGGARPLGENSTGNPLLDGHVARGSSRIETSEIPRSVVPGPRNAGQSRDERNPLVARLSSHELSTDEVVEVHDKPERPAPLFEQLVAEPEPSLGQPMKNHTAQQTPGKFDLSMDQLEDIFGEAGGSGPRAT